jgi:hypothetical protein
MRAVRERPDGNLPSAPGPLHAFAVTEQDRTCRAGPKDAVAYRPGHHGTAPTNDPDGPVNHPSFHGRPSNPSRPLGPFGEGVKGRSRVRSVADFVDGERAVKAAHSVRRQPGQAQVTSVQRRGVSIQHSARKTGDRPASAEALRSHAFS